MVSGCWHPGGVDRAAVHVLSDGVGYESLGLA